MNFKHITNTLKKEIIYLDAAKEWSITPFDGMYIINHPDVDNGSYITDVSGLKSFYNEHQTEFQDMFKDYTKVTYQKTKKEVVETEEQIKHYIDNANKEEYSKRIDTLKSKDVTNILKLAKSLRK